MRLEDLERRRPYEAMLADLRCPSRGSVSTLSTMRQSSTPALRDFIGSIRERQTGLLIELARRTSGPPPDRAGVQPNTPRSVSRKFLTELASLARVYDLRAVDSRLSSRVDDQVMVVALEWLVEMDGGQSQAKEPLSIRLRPLKADTLGLASLTRAVGPVLGLFVMGSRDPASERLLESPQFLHLAKDVSRSLELDALAWTRQLVRQGANKIRELGGEGRPT